MAKEVGVTEQLKMMDQLRWTGMMSAIKNQIEGFILNEMIYRLRWVGLMNTIKA